MTVGYHTWSYAFNEILCGVEIVTAIEQAVVELIICDPEMFGWSYDDTLLPEVVE